MDGSIKRRMVSFALLFLIVGLGGGSIPEEVFAQCSEEAQPDSFKAADDLSAEQKEAYTEASTLVLEFLFWIVGAFVLTAIAVGYAIRGNSTVLKSHRPFDPEKDRRDTREGPLRLW